ncbi:hypothetical protein ACQ86B_12150 [Mycolicibacterium aichiense]|uniref:hypothetical protein n=1 Tax=Mycolicibacterium aichiense TaxID=1799 RepID=UPI003D66D872
MSAPHDDEAAELLHASLTKSVRRLVDVAIRSQADLDRITSAPVDVRRGHGARKGSSSTHG